MADEEIVYQVSVETGGGEKSITQLRQEFKELQKSLAGTVAGSAKFNETIKALGANRGQLTELKSGNALLTTAKD